MAKPYPNHPQLRGNFAPIRMECDVADVIIRGEMPAELDVSYFPQWPGSSVRAPR